MEKLKKYLNKIFKYDYEGYEDFNFIEQTDDGKFIFYPQVGAKGYEVESLKDFKFILIYWRLSAVFSVFWLMTLFIILVIFVHQMFNMDGFFTLIILTLCLTSCLVSGFFMWYLRKYRKVEPKYITTDLKKVTGIFVLLYTAIIFVFLYSCPCIFYDHNIKNQEWQKALNKINVYLKIRPKNDNLYENRALVKYNLNDIDGAIKDCDKALELNPKNSWVLSAKAYYTFVKTRKMTPEINSMFEKSMNLNEKDYPIAYSDRGKVYYLAGESDKAVKDFEQAYLKSGNEYFNYYAALAYEQKGDYCKTFAYYNTLPPPPNKKYQIVELPMKKEYARFMCKD